VAQKAKAEIAAVLRLICMLMSSNEENDNPPENRCR